MCATRLLLAVFFDVRRTRCIVQDLAGGWRDQAASQRPELTNNLTKMCSRSPKTTLLHRSRSILCGKAGVLGNQGSSASSSFSSTAVFHEKKNALYLKSSKNTASSNDWLKRQLSDPYVRWARVDQYRLFVKNAILMQKYLFFCSL